MPNSPAAGRLTNAEFRALIQCSRSQLNRWEKAGLPFVAVKSRRGSPSHLYDVAAALGWVKDHGTGRYPLEAARLLKGGGKKKTGGGKPAVSAREAEAEESGVGGEKSTTAEMMESLERVKGIHDHWAEETARAMEDGDLKKASLCSRSAAEMGKVFLQMNEQALTLHKELGVLVVASEVEGRHLKVLNVIRNNVLGIPDSAVPLLLPLLREADDGAKAREVLKRLVDDVLRHIANSGRD